MPRLRGARHGGGVGGARGEQRRAEETSPGHQGTALWFLRGGPANKAENNAGSFAFIGPIFGTVGAAETCCWLRALKHVSDFFVHSSYVLFLFRAHVSYGIVTDNDCALVVN